MAKKSTTGLKKETAAALSYVLGPITGVLMLVLESDQYVRFHAMQSIVTFGVLIVIQWVFGFLVLTAVFIPLVALLGFVLWLVLIYKALQGEKWEVPILGPYVRQLL